MAGSPDGTRASMVAVVSGKYQMWITALAWGILLPFYIVLSNDGAVMDKLLSYLPLR